MQLITLMDFIIMSRQISRNADMKNNLFDYWPSL